MSGYQYRASWPILRPTLGWRDLIDEGRQALHDLADADRVHLIGEVSWSIRGGRLYAEVAAEPAATPTPRRRRPDLYPVAARIEQVRHMATVQRLTDRQIAAVLGGCTESAVAHARARHGIPPGVGNPTLTPASGQQAA